MAFLCVAIAWVYFGCAWTCVTMICKASERHVASLRCIFHARAREPWDNNNAARSAETMGNKHISAERARQDIR